MCLVFMVLRFMSLRSKVQVFLGLDFVGLGFAGYKCVGLAVILKDRNPVFIHIYLHIDIIYRFFQKFFTICSNSNSEGRFVISDSKNTYSRLGCRRFYICVVMLSEPPKYYQYDPLLYYVQKTSLQVAIKIFPYLINYMLKYIN